MYLKCPNIYGIHMHVYPYVRQYIEPVITACQWIILSSANSLFANNLNLDKDQHNVGLDLDPNCLTL